MSFYSFKLDKLVIKRKRGNIPDDDVVTFSVVVNQLDRGHGAATFVVLTSGSEASTEDRDPDGLLARRAMNRFNMSEHWVIGPLEIKPGDHVSVLYTGTNVSDEQLVSVASERQDELEIKILNYVAKKYVELIAGAEFASDVASALSEALIKHSRTRSET